MSDKTEYEHDDEMIEVPIVPEPLSAIALASLNLASKHWHVKAQSSMLYVFEHKVQKHCTCTVTVVGRDAGKTVSFSI